MKRRGSEPEALLFKPLWIGVFRFIYDRTEAKDSFLGKIRAVEMGKYLSLLIHWQFVLEPDNLWSKSKHIAPSPSQFRYRTLLTWVYNLDSDKTAWKTDVLPNSGESLDGSRKIGYV